MGDVGELLVVGDPPIKLLVADQTSATSALWQWGESGLTTRMLRGRKMRSVAGLFDEMAAALQFPSYFGENWAAFGECLADMDWLPQEQGIVLAIFDPNEVLADAAAGELRVLVQILTHAAQVYSEAIDSGEWWDRPAIPFRVLLHALPSDRESVRSRWEAAGAEVSVLSAWSDAEVTSRA